MAGVVHIDWYATVLRQERFAQEVASAASLALRYGATAYSVHRSRDDRYKVMQIKSGVEIVVKQEKISADHVHLYNAGWASTLNKLEELVKVGLEGSGYGGYAIGDDRFITDYSFDEADILGG